MDLCEKAAQRLAFKRSEESLDMKRNKIKHDKEP